MTGCNHPQDDHTSNPSAGNVRELARVFTRLGFTAFGGPAAHVALIEEQVVIRRGWLDRSHFLDLVAAINFIPGPNSTELVIHIGQLRAGLRGLIVAGACFIFPAMLIILPLAWIYVQWGTLPQLQPPLRAINAAVAAVVVMATLRFGITALRSPFTIGLAIATLLAVPIMKRYTGVQPEIPILILAATAGIVRTRLRPALLAISLPPDWWQQIGQLALEMLKIGATLFGSGYVLVSYLQSSMVDEHGWLTAQQLSDAIAVGQFTPGPLLTTATFVGYILGAMKFGGGVAGGVVGGIVATIAIFLPSFILVWLVGPTIQRIRAHPGARGALDAMNAAVVGLMAVAALWLVASALYDAPTQRINWLGSIILCISLIGLWRNINATWLILAAGIVGAIIGS